MLWDELIDTPSIFVLYGGTAIALQLGHRTSVDFDFFARCAISPRELLQSISYLKKCDVLQQSSNTLTCRVDRGGPVKFSFFGLPDMNRINPLLKAPANGLHIASLLDLAGTKALTVQQRAEAKDYLDLDAILSEGITLTDILLAARVIFGSPFSPQLTLKALTYFGDGDLGSLADAVKSRLVHAVRSVDLHAVAQIKDISQK